MDGKKTTLLYSKCICRCIIEVHMIVYIDWAFALHKLIRKSLPLTIHWDLSSNVWMSHQFAQILCWIITISLNIFSTNEGVAEELLITTLYLWSESICEFNTLEVYSLDRKLWLQYSYYWPARVTVIKRVFKSRRNLMTCVIVNVPS